MAKVILKRTRIHGYAKLVPADKPELATFRGVKPEDPFARRNVDASGGPAMVEIPVGGGAFKREMLAPKPENIEHLQPGFQHIGVYRSQDGRYELAIELTPSEAQNPPETVEIDPGL